MFVYCVGCSADFKGHAAELSEVAPFAFWGGKKQKMKAEKPAADQKSL